MCVCVCVCVCAVCVHAHGCTHAQKPHARQVPDIYDSAKYDAIHNALALGLDTSKLHKLYEARACVRMRVCGCVCMFWRFACVYMLVSA